DYYCYSADSSGALF
nr:immunoglobulin light chain junction region [Macaca mulatta]MOW66248.1 immunoglobulin light chain junction region [Macaca mulatta]MOW67003.1 immunoglobulin light chain junction region [Macaca mulatta]MOW67365.1 immunoglobulin light chain junction region [Macaca mulatta]MOW67798.1 immunoglobulin light chain junction region [Macaca mulatta]